MLFLVPVSMSTFAQHGPPELQTETQSLSPDISRFSICSRWTIQTWWNQEERKRGTTLGANLNVTSHVLKIVVSYHILCIYEVQKGNTSDPGLERTTFWEKLMKRNFRCWKCPRGHKRTVLPSHKTLIKHEILSKCLGRPSKCNEKWSVHIEAEGEHVQSARCLHSAIAPVCPQVMETSGWAVNFISCCKEFIKIISEVSKLSLRLSACFTSERKVFIDSRSNVTVTLYIQYSWTSMPGRSTQLQEQEPSCPKIFGLSTETLNKPGN